MVYDNNYIGYACAFNSQGDVEIFIKATGAPGWHFIDLYPGIYKGQETRPNNFRIPQLTYADDHPGEDLPAFHFAFEVTPDGHVGELKPSSTVGLVRGIEPAAIPQTSCARAPHRAGTSGSSTGNSTNTSQRSAASAAWATNTSRPSVSRAEQGRLRTAGTRRLYLGQPGDIALDHVDI